MTATLRTWRLDLPYEKPPLNANDSLHHMAIYRARRNLTEQVRWLIRGAGIPRLDRIHVELHYLPALVRTRDQDNLVATLKPAIDGMKDTPAKYDGARLVRPAWVGIVPDDDPAHVTWTPPVIHDVVPNRRHERAPKRLWLVITEGAPDA